MNVFSYFTDAVLRGPTIGSMLMCFTAALIGTLTFLRRQSLIGEALSHAAYPGVIFGVIFSGILSLDSDNELKITFLILLGAFITALFGLWSIYFLEKRLRISSDSALCFILSIFFGIGVTFASDVQFSYTTLYRQAQAYLYGQAATMSDIHIIIYGLLAAIILGTVIFFDKELQTIIFNQEYAKSLGIKVNAINALIFILTVLAVVIGIRSVGVVLMSAMLIAPAVAARQFTNRFNSMLLLAGIFGLLSGFFGNYFSIELSKLLNFSHSQTRFSLPTGPMIVLTASVICIFALLFAPERGLFLRYIRTFQFKFNCISENILKAIWRQGPEKTITFDQFKQYQNVSSIYLKLILFRLIRNEWLEKVSSDTFKLTSKGQHKAAHIVRLHRLWELYLADYIGVGVEKVHRNAEEMEHIITPEIEKELTLLLHDPQYDPHHQQIPPKEIDS